MNYYETGKIDGKSQFEMDKLTKTKREGEQLAYTAITSHPENFEQALDRLSISEYVSGFIESYLIAIIRNRKEECEEAATKYNEMEGQYRRIPRETIQRKQYAINAQTELLQTILNEIGVEAQ